MRLGFPKHESKRIVKDGKEEQKISTNHNILYTANARGQGKKLNWEVTWCTETPSKETCKPCTWEMNCNFSKAKER